MHFICICSWRNFFCDHFNDTQVDKEGVELLQLKKEIQKIQKELEVKQKKADTVERRIDEKNSLLKVSEFIQNQPDKIKDLESSKSLIK